MSRPSTHTDTRLIEVALRMASEKGGFTRLSLREVAREADVNLGMFHYHFRNKAEFIRRLLEAHYEHFFKSFAIEAEQGENCLHKLRSALIQMSQFGRDHRQIGVALINDLIQQDEMVLDFVRQNVCRHMDVIAGLIAEGQREGLITPMPMPQAMMFVMSGCCHPTITIAKMERIASVSPKLLDEFRDTILTDEAIAQRVSMSLKGITTLKGARMLQAEPQLQAEPA